MALGVGDEVRHDSLESTFVDVQVGDRGGLVHHEGDLARTGAGGERVPHELSGGHDREGEVRDPGVETRDLEEVEDHPLEPVDLSRQQVQCLLTPLGQLVASESSTAAEFASVVSGERSSCATSDAIFASRSIRSWMPSTI